MVGPPGLLLLRGMELQQAGLQHLFGHRGGPDGCPVFCDFLSQLDISFLFQFKEASVIVSLTVSLHQLVLLLGDLLQPLSKVDLLVLL
jgi:hypothetical protein